ncbi:MAG: beta-ketoacyl synthase N-terminal-like domain-containing protein [Gammaproteobacteria bacterium]|nr:beta-ketoacyl synthase N-terminal-like domain-containing protein [Gammaproteobacteria bacterium]
MTWAVRLNPGSLLTAYGRGLEKTVQALREGRRAQTRGLSAFPHAPSTNVVSTLDPAEFTASLSGVRRGLHAIAQAALAGLTSQRAWLLTGTSGVLFLGACAGDSGAWIGCDGDITDDLARDLGLTAAPLTLSTACSSTANALLLAGQAVAEQRYPCALVVGFEAISHIVLEGFESLMLLDDGGCRPFDRDRDGLHLGEGIAAQGLERAPAGTRQRGAILLGGAHVCAAWGPAAQAPDADAMYAVMAEALRAAEREPRDIVAIKAHGLGSVASDRAEAQALRRLYPSLPPVTSLKGGLGHTLAASGVLETAAFVACLEAGFIPPTAGFAHADPTLGVHPIGMPLSAQEGCYQLNFFGFGASYVSLVVAWRP